MRLDVVNTFLSVWLRACWYSHMTCMYHQGCFSLEFRLGKLWNQKSFEWLLYIAFTWASFGAPSMESKVLNVTGRQVETLSKMYCAIPVHLAGSSMAVPLVQEWHSMHLGQLATGALWLEDQERWVSCGGVWPNSCQPKVLLWLGKWHENIHLANIHYLLSSLWAMSHGLFAIQEHSCIVTSCDTLHMLHSAHVTLSTCYTLHVLHLLLFNECDKDAVGS